MTDEYRDVPNGYVYLYEQRGWVAVARGDYATRMRKVAAADHPSPSKVQAGSADLTPDHL